MHLGKYRAGLGCVSAIGNQGVQLPSFEVLTNALSGVWLTAKNGAVPPGAFPAGYESIGVPQYVCRVAWQDGLHPGKLLAGVGCQYQYGSAGGNLLQVVGTSYDVLVPTPALGPGPARIHTKATGKFWVEGSDGVINTLSQPDTTASRFTVQGQTDGSYQVIVQADNKALHEDGGGDKLLSIRYQPNDGYTRFYFEQQND